MDRERVTTNRDARDALLTSKGKHLLNEHDFMLYASKNGLSNNMVDFLNKIIKYALPEDIVNAVENSNGYGKRYINYLKKNNKLTPTKIEQLRLAMIHVPSYLLPVAGGYTLYNIFNQPQQQLQYLKQGGKTHKPSQRSRPWGHRSILDNGWQSTKLLKNKKNVYGK